MLLAENRFRVLHKAGKWNSPCAQEEKIISLQVQLKKLTGKGISNTKDDTKVKSSKNDGKKKERVRPAWMLVKPTDLTEKKTVNNKDFWWCERENMWAAHKPEDCKELPFSKTRNKDKEKAEKKKDKLV